MLPKYHLLSAIIVSIILFIFNIKLLFIFVFLMSAVLIDLDHYLGYFYNKADANFFHYYNWHIRKSKKYFSMPISKRRTYKKDILIFHGIEFWLILLILSFFSKIFLFILLGVAVHIFLDFIDLYRKKEPFYYKSSLIITLIKDRNKKEFLS